MCSAAALHLRSTEGGEKSAAECAGVSSAHYGAAALSMSWSEMNRNDLRRGDEEKLNVDS